MENLDWFFLQGAPLVVCHCLTDLSGTTSTETIPCTRRWGQKRTGGGKSDKQEEGRVSNISQCTEGDGTCTYVCIPADIGVNAGRQKQSRCIRENSVEEGTRKPAWGDSELKRELPEDNVGELKEGALRIVR